MEPGSLIPPGIWTLADVLEYGRDKGVCPYFAVRRMVRLRKIFFKFVAVTYLRKDAICGHYHLFFPLPSRPEGRGASVQGDVQRCHCRLRRSSQHRQVGPLTLHCLTAYMSLVDNVCIESLSIDLTRPMMDAAGRSVIKLADKIEE